MLCGISRRGRRSALDGTGWIGLFVSGPDFDTAFGLMHTIEKAAQIASIALAATGGKPLRQVITDDNLRDIGKEFGVTLNEEILDFKSDDEMYC